MKCNILTLRQNQWDWELQHNKSNGYYTIGPQKFTVIMFREGTWFCKTHFYFTGISAISHYLTVVSQQQRWYLQCCPPRNTESRNPEEKASREQTAKKLHLPNANYDGMSLTMDCWDCQIKPHLAMLSVWVPTAGRHIHESFDYDIELLQSQLSPLPPPWVGLSGGGDLS